MLIWAIIFLVVAVIAGYFTFQKKKSNAKQIAKIVFYTFLVLFVVSLILWIAQVYYHPSVDMKVNPKSIFTE